MEQPAGRLARFRGRHPADLLFLVALVVAVPTIRYAQRAQWFAGDEWALVFEKHLMDPASLLELQNGHITTLPAVLYRLIYNVVGLHHYWPYQALAIATHLGIVVLLRVVMLRAGVDRWIASIAAGVVLFFGSGNQNMATGFQITLTGPIALGLLMLLAVDHGGPLGRRDALGVLCGLAAVACSSAAVPMLVAVGVTVWIRRSLRTVAVLVAPPVALFVVWTRFVPSDQPQPERAGAAGTIRFARMLWLDTYEALGQSVLVGAALLLLLVMGWGLGSRAVRSGAVALDRFVPSAALLAAAVVMALTVGWARGASTLWAAPTTSLERYLYLIAALSMPGLAVALSECARRWKPATAGAIVLLLLGLPGNAQRLGLSSNNAEVGDEAMLLQIADLAVEMEPPDDMRVILPRGSGIRLTVGGLRDARIAGQVPDPLDGTDRQRQRAFLLLLLAPSTNTGTVGCAEVTSGDPIALREGDRVVMDAPVQVRRLVDGELGDEAHVPLSLVSPYAVESTWGPAAVVVKAQPDITIHHCPAMDP